MTLIPSSILVRGKRIGIIGLEAAIANLLASNKDLDSRKAAERIFEAIRGKNYIPTGLEDEYLSGLEAVWCKVTGKGDKQDIDGFLDIKILGPGCVSCNRLEEMVRDILDKWGFEADITHIHELDEIWRHGVTKTPALIINDKVMSQGRLPTLAQVESWIRDQQK